MLEQEFKKLSKNKPLFYGGILALLLLIYLYYQRNGIANRAISGTTNVAGLPTSFGSTYVDATGKAHYGEPESLSPMENGVLPIPSEYGVGTVVDGPGAVQGGQMALAYKSGTVPTPGTHFPLIPYNQLPAGTRYATQQDIAKQPYLTWMGVKYKKIPGPPGFLYGNPTDGGEQVLLYGPPSAYS